VKEGQQYVHLSMSEQCPGILTLLLWVNNLNCWAENGLTPWNHSAQGMCKSLQ